MTQQMTLVEPLLAPIQRFLLCETPKAWLERARQPESLAILLRDHLLCELKAAQSAVFLLKRYVLTEAASQQLALFIEPYEDLAYRKIGDLKQLNPQKAHLKQLEIRPDCAYGQEMRDKMLLLIREELHHFYQVLEIMQDHHIDYAPIPASRYARTLFKQVRTYEPAALVDKLIIGAYIEARSCERFFALSPYLPAPIAQFYRSLLRSEARHYQDYLALAQDIAQTDIQDRIQAFGTWEAELINRIDADFKFHSGIPV